jgi:hypothetical protein
MLKRSQVFTNLRWKVKAYVLSCDVCQRAKADCHLPRGHVQNIEIPVKKWDSISMDFVSFPPTRLTDGDREYDEILTITDRATKMVTLIMCQSTWSAAQVAERFFWEVVRYRGVPRSIVSDRDAIFMSNFWVTLMTFLDIRLRRSSPYHPQTNGQAERTNGTLKQVLRALLLERPWENWLDLIGLAEIAINSAPIANTEYSPFYLNCGYHPAFWWDLPEGGILPEEIPRNEAVRVITRRMSEDWKAVRGAFEKEQRRVNEYANKKRANNQFQLGQDVLINRRRHFRGQFGSGKGPLAPRAVGPFPIIKVITPTTFLLDIPLVLRGRASPIFHSSDLIPYETRLLDPMGMLPEDEPDEEPEPGGVDGSEGGEGPDDEGGGEGPATELEPPVVSRWAAREEEELGRVVPGGGGRIDEEDEPSPYLPEDPRWAPSEDSGDRDDPDDDSDTEVDFSDEEEPGPFVEMASEDSRDATGDDENDDEVPPRPKVAEVEEPEGIDPAEEGGIDFEGERELRERRGHPHPEPEVVTPVEIPAHVRFWLDRMRTGGHPVDAAPPDSSGGDPRLTVVEQNPDETPLVSLEMPNLDPETRSGAKVPAHVRLLLDRMRRAMVQEVNPVETIRRAEGEEPHLSNLVEDDLGEVMLLRLPGEHPFPPFDLVEDVKMQPEIFMRVCRDLLVTPCIDLFASRWHHQIPRYFTAEEDDKAALGCNAFAYLWDPGVCLYANPPWSVIPQMLQKICKDKSRVVEVTPYWVDAPWYPLLQSITLMSIQGKLRPPPRWLTIASYVVGTAQ